MRRRLSAENTAPPMVAKMREALTRPVTDKFVHEAMPPEKSERQGDSVWRVWLVVRTLGAERDVTCSDAVECVMQMQCCTCGGVEQCACSVQACKCSC